MRDPPPGDEVAAHGPGHEGREVHAGKTRIDAAHVLEERGREVQRRPEHDPAGEVDGRGEPGGARPQHPPWEHGFGGVPLPSHEGHPEEARRDTEADDRGDPHDARVPPQLVISTKQVIAATSSTAPR